MAFASDVSPEYYEIDSFLSQQEYYEEETAYRGSPISSITGLNNLDYNLSSPLIRDKSDAMTRLTQSSIAAPRRLSRPWWTKISSSFRENIKGIKLLNSQFHHKIWARISQSTIKHVGEIEKLISRTNEDVNITFPILEAFIKGWLRKRVSACVKTLIPRKVLEYGQLFLSMYKIILIMNHKTEMELENLRKWIGFSFISKDTTTSSVVSFKDKNLGEILIGGGFCVFKKYKILVDRDFCLMIKDTWSSRFHSLMSLIGRSDKKYPENSIEEILTLYKTGDVIITKCGNEGYKGIKMLEPMCLERLADLAHEYRPLIPNFSTFGEHVDNCIQEGGEFRNELRLWKDQIKKITSPDLVVAFFGSFRHWGHPYLEYLLGLEKLHSQVNKVKDIDVEYSESLASDLSKMVLHKIFKEKRKWSVDKKFVIKSHPLYNHIQQNTWPTAAEILQIGDTWHMLPLVKCFDTPDVIDPTVLYSDKSHSMKRSDVINHIKHNSEKPIPSLKVLNTYLNTESTDWPTFLNEVDKNGLGKEDLVIGLKGKERELKIEGRFFALMSWKLREYFVFTEYLLKTHFVPLFKGLTMADDLTDLTKKMLDTTNGQGSDDYDSVCISNHFDYEKWNNNQRSESTNPVFSVMGKFLGYPNLISRTHEFFKKSLVYYNDRPDLMNIANDVVTCKPGTRVAWEGQLGGLEGLRQKGWSILSLLVIQRSAKIRNTQIRTLAQGDNQVVCSQYKTPPIRDNEELQQALTNLAKNNQIIVEEIISGAKKVGLDINKDETVQSADMLIYGKVPVFRGNIMGLDNKRYSRISCITNDQIPSFSNIMGSVSTNILTVSHFSSSPVEPMRQYGFFFNLTRNLVEMHNPVLQSSMKQSFSLLDTNASKLYKILSMYLDPSLGGISGTSLSRFLIRMFPDPITESLSFWKLISENTQDLLIKNLCIVIGEPKMSTYIMDDLDKLIESPTSLNIKKGQSVSFLLKNEIKIAMQKSPDSIKNKMVKSAINYSSREEIKMKTFLYSINPLFPRFLSEFKSATYMGIVDSITGLFQNARTIRNYFKSKMNEKVNKIMITSEINGIDTLIRLSRRRPSKMCIWECSSEKADELRRLSWGRSVIGATIPHPIEMIRNNEGAKWNCKDCFSVEGSDDYLTTSVPRGLTNYYHSRGPMQVYLGSKTQESTSLLQPWEKETSIPLLRRASKLRNTIHWFVNEDSKLAKSILSIMEGLTGEKWSSGLVGFKRTGSSLHRFSSSRQSSGGYCATSPVKLSRMMTTTDTMSSIGSDNYDFMFQALILYAQISVGEIHDGDNTQGVYHAHISCKRCLRKISEPTLESSDTYIHPDMSEVIKKWIPEGVKMGEIKILNPIKTGNWSKVSYPEGSYQIGRSIGFIFGDLTYSGDSGVDKNSLFPLALKNKLIPQLMLEGILDGLMRASSLNILHRRNSQDKSDLQRSLQGSVLFLITRLTELPAALNIFRDVSFQHLFSSSPHKTPPSYPMNSRDIGQSCRSYLESLFISPSINYGIKYKSRYANLWIFADLYLSKLVGLFLISNASMNLVLNYSGINPKVSKRNLFSIKKTIEVMREKEGELISPRVSKNAILCNSEMRDAAKTLKEKYPDGKSLYEIKLPNWCESKDGDITAVKVSYEQINSPAKKEYIFPRRESCPLINGIRIIQAATGAHYKIRAIFSKKKIAYRDFICGGDGSGGLTAFLLRWNIGSKGIFNSILEYEDVDLRGAKPEEPSALHMSAGVSIRCVNSQDCWKNPSDLSECSTWDYFRKLKSDHELNIDLILLDMEMRTEEQASMIEDCLLSYLHVLLLSNGSVIYKTYLNYILSNKRGILFKIGRFFETVELIQTTLSGFGTSEVYILFRNLRSESSPDIHPNYNELSESVNVFSCYNTVKEEFRRSLTSKKNSLHYKCPPSVLPSLTMETTRILEFSGLAGGLSLDLAYNFSVVPDKDLVNYILSIMILIWNEALPISKKMKKRNNPPSDSMMEKVGAFTSGVLMWLGWCLENFSLFNQGFLIFRNHFPCYLTYNLMPTESGKEKRVHLSWNIKGPGLNKTCRVNQYSAFVARVIRCLTRHKKDSLKGCISLAKVSEFTRNQNVGLNLELIKLNTPIIAFLNNDQFILESEPRFYVRQKEFDSSGWRE